jgi:Concanavalin A-like lectin/glucanases superfamily/Abnormal spindle-like microcephaly-assoc'd, ASPM-SPD-2-Hydin
LPDWTLHLRIEREDLLNMRRKFLDFAVVAGIATAALVFGPRGQAQTACSPAPSGITAWWPGDGNADDIIGGNNGTLVGGVTFAPGEVGEAFSFDGTSGYVNVPSSSALQPQSAISVAAWVNPTSFSDPNGSAIVAKYDSAGQSWALVAFQNTGQLEWGVYGSSQYFAMVTGVNLTVGPGWQHVAATFDTATQAVAVYINGVQVPISCRSGYTCGTVTSIYQSSAPVQIGAYTGGNGITGFWDGLIDEVQIYDVALSAAQVQAIYNAGSAGNCKGLTFSPSALQFPRQTIGTTSVPETVTATNSFPLPVTVSTATTSGPFIPTNNCEILAPAASCAVNVTFAPSQPGPQHGTLTITDSAPASPQTVSLAGGATDLSLSPPNLLYFGSHAVGTTSHPQTETTKNVATTVVKFASPVIAGADPSDFIITANTCGTSLAPGASCTISLEFKPTATGTRSAILEINDNGGDSPQKVVLVGSGT